MKGLELKIKNNIIIKMEDEGLDYKNYDDVCKFLEDYISDDVLLFMAKTGIDVMWYTNKLENDFEVVVQEL